MGIAVKTWKDVENDWIAENYKMRWLVSLQIGDWEGVRENFRQKDSSLPEEQRVISQKSGYKPQLSSRPLKLPYSIYIL